MKKQIKTLIKAAKEKATEYKTEKIEEQPTETAAEKVAEQEKPSTEQTLEIQVWGDYVNQQIEEAMRAGQFDNLKGKGKPQDLRRNPFVPEDQELAFNLLSNNDLVPGWISDRTAILTAIKQCPALFEQSSFIGSDELRNGLINLLTKQQKQLLKRLLS